MFRIMLVLLCTSALLLSECVGTPKSSTGTLKIYATGPLGDALNVIEVHLLSNYSDVRSFRTKSTELRLPYGTYRLRVSALGFRNTEREIRVNQPHEAIQMDLAVAQTGCPIEPFSIFGRVVGPLGDTPLWAKAVQVRGAEVGEALVGTDGRFRIAGLNVGAHVLMLLQGETVVHQQVVQAGRHDSEASTIRIDLRSDRPVSPAVVQ